MGDRLFGGGRFVAILAFALAMLLHGRFHLVLGQLAVAVRVQLGEPLFGLRLAGLVLDATDEFLLRQDAIAVRVAFFKHLAVVRTAAFFAAVAFATLGASLGLEDGNKGQRGGCGYNQCDTCFHVGQAVQVAGE